MTSSALALCPPLTMVTAPTVALATTSQTEPDAAISIIN